VSIVENSRIFVEKNVNNPSTLASIMPLHLCNIMEVVKKCQNFNSVLKKDSTPVTDLDLSLCGLINQIQKEKFPHHIYFSEEKNADWKYPMMVVDPVDGTKEFIKGSDEWVISVALIENESFQGEGWIFQPKKKKVYDSGLSLKTSSDFVGEVSHTEWEEGLFRQIDLKLKPMGSIALKLARLADRESAFVVSLKPKNIWDIAAGTILLKQRGFEFYSQGKRVTEVKKEFQPPLIWCAPEDASLLLKTFS